MQDIVPKKSIREITKPKREIPEKILETVANEPFVKTKETEHKVSSSHAFNEEYPHQKPTFPKKQKNLGTVFLLVAIPLLIITATILHLNKSATVFIKTEQYPLSFKNTEVIITENEYKVITETLAQEIKIITTKGEPVLTKAKGEVVVYNASSIDQILVASTRLESNTGLIYRLNERIVVPRSTTVSGKVTPGSITASVTAEKAGEKYNLKQADFSIPGLQSTPRYTQVYARTKSAISGGLEGSTLSIDEKDKQQKIDAILSQKSEELKKNLLSKKPENTKLIQEPIITTSFEKKTDEEGIVTLIATMQVIDLESLSMVLIRNQKQSIESPMEFSSNPDTLTFLYVKGNPDGLTLNITGNAVLQSRIDLNNIKKELEGKKFNQFREIMKKVNGVEESRFTSKPFWIGTFPKSSNISIERS